MRSMVKLVVIAAVAIGLGTLAATSVLAVPAGAAAASPPAARATVTLEVSGMHCSVCPITVRKALLAAPGVEKATVTLEPPRAVVVYDPSRVRPEQLMKATADAGYPSKVVAKG